MLFCDKEFVNNLKNQMSIYDSFTSIPLGGLFWEETIVKSLEKTGYKALWDIGSHVVGRDIEILSENIIFSAKSGVFTFKAKSKKNIISFSSYRTTKCPTLKEKIDYFNENGKSFTHYLLVARASNQRSQDKFVKSKYKVYMIESERIKTLHSDWEECFGRANKNITGWKTNWVNNISMKISRSMSDQFWISIDESELLNNLLFEI